MPPLPFFQKISEKMAHNIPAVYGKMWVKFAVGMFANEVGA
jgi:hypothetical protein